MKGIVVEVAETKGLVGFLRFNQLFPPFDKPAIRRAILAAVNQTEFMQAVVGGNAAFDDRCGVFGVASPMSTDAGVTVMAGNHDVAPIKRALEKAGYAGERVVYLAQQQDLARQIQLQAWQDVPFLPLGSYNQPTAYWNTLSGMLKGLILFTNVRRT